MITRQAVQSFLSTKTIIYGMLSIAIFALIIWNIRDRVFGAPLSIATARDGSTIQDTILPIAGNARHARELTINGRRVTIDRAGNFDDQIVLSPGYNIVEIASTDQFGKTKQKVYQYVFSPAQSVATTSGSPYQ